MISLVVLEKKIFKDLKKNPTWHLKYEYDKMAEVILFSFALYIATVLFYLYMKFEHDRLSGLGVPDCQIIWYFSNMAAKSFDLNELCKIDSQIAVQ